MMMSREKNNELHFEDVQSLCQILFLAITAICSHNPQAEISASREMSFILQTMLTMPDLGADDCLTKILDHNEHLLRQKVTEDHVKLIVKVSSKILENRWQMTTKYRISPILHTLCPQTEVLVSHVHSWQLLQKEFFLKPSYMSFLEAVCSVSDGQAVPHQQISVFNLFVKKHENLLNSTETL